MREKARSHRLMLVIVATTLAVAAVVGTGVAYALGRSSAPSIAASNPIQPTNLAVPTRIASIPLVDELGRTVDLANLRGSVVVLADFMTSCQEECPITTSALVTVSRELAADHLLGKVKVVEVSVDASRDTPSRMLAYKRAFGVPFTLLTGSRTDLARLWSWLGVSYARVPEDSPPDLDWQTGQPYTFDIVHTDNVFVLSPAGVERALVEANANVGGKIPRRLADLLSPEGRKDLVDPGAGSWTSADLLQAIAAALGRPIAVER